ncbi:MAG TPA: glycosyltransferase family 1 protein [Patescibacteria group bacterium]|nr:glycosyltransferase family 1 protein [Patescibacteria group bacterium]
MPKHIVIDARIRRTSTGRYVDRLVDHLQDIDRYNSYTILVQPDDNWQMKAANFKTLPCPFPQFSMSPLPDLKFALQLYKLRPDLVHFSMTQQPLLYFGKIVTTTHDLTMFRFVRRGQTSKPVFAVKMGLYRFLFKWSHMKSDRIIVPTRYVADDLAAYQPSTKHKIVVTYESGELPKTGAAKRPTAVGENDEFIMYLGTAFPHKNLPRLVEAFEIIKAAHPKLKLVLVGKTEKHYEDLAKFASNQPHAEDIIITGFLPDDEAKWLYQHTKAYVFPSLSEGFGLPALEAMGYGAPVVSSDATCLPELYGNAAHYFDATSPQDIAKKVAEVISSKTLRDKLVKNESGVLAKYSWTKMAGETLDAYQDVLAAKNPAKEPDFDS